MILFLNYVSHYWGLWVTLFCSGLVCAYTAREILAERKRRQKTVLVMDILGASTEPQKSVSIPLSIRKTMRANATKILMLVIGLSIGYAAGVYRQNNYQKEHADWQAKNAQWQRYFNVYESTHKGE